MGFDGFIGDHMGFYGVPWGHIGNIKLYGSKGVV